MNGKMFKGKYIPMNEHSYWQPSNAIRKFSQICSKRLFAVKFWKGEVFEKFWKDQKHGSYGISKA